MTNASRCRKINAMAREKLEKSLRQPQRRQAEAEFEFLHASDTDRQLLDYIKDRKRVQGKHMKPVNTVGYLYLCRRLGPWPRFMTQVNQELEEEKKGAEIPVTPA